MAAAGVGAEAASGAGPAGRHPAAADDAAGIAGRLTVAGPRGRGRRRIGRRVGREPRYMVVNGVRAPVDDGLAASGVDYERFTSLAGPLSPPPASPTGFSTGASTTAGANGC